MVRVVGVGCGLGSDWELINIHFPSSMGAQQAVWLIDTFVGMVWDEIFIFKKGTRAEERTMFWISEIQIQDGSGVGNFIGYLARACYVG